MGRVRKGSAHLYFGQCRPGHNVVMRARTYICFMRSSTTWKASELTLNSPR